MKKLLILWLSILSAGIVFGVIFADDTIRFIKAGKAVTDNTVIVKDNRSGEYKVARNGTVIYKQTSEEYTITVYRSSEPIPSEKEFEKNNEGLEKTYPLFLADAAGKDGFEIKIPVSPDQSVSQSPPPGMTGGVIGRSRTLTIDLGSKSITGFEIETEPAVFEVPAPSRSIALPFGIAIGIVAVSVIVVLIKKNKKK